MNLKILTIIIFVFSCKVIYASNTPGLAVKFKKLQDSKVTHFKNLINRNKRDIIILASKLNLPPIYIDKDSLKINEGASFVYKSMADTNLISQISNDQEFTSFIKKINHLFFYDLELQFWLLLKIETKDILNAHKKEEFTLAMLESTIDQYRKKYKNTSLIDENLIKKLKQAFLSEFKITDKDFQLYKTNSKYVKLKVEKSYPHDNQFNYYPSFSKKRHAYIKFKSDEMYNYNRLIGKTGKFVIKITQGGTKSTLYIIPKRHFARDIDFTYPMPESFFKANMVYTVELIDVILEDDYLNDEEIVLLLNKKNHEERAILFKAHFRCSPYYDFVDMQQTTYIKYDSLANHLTLDLPTYVDEEETDIYSLWDFEKEYAYDSTSLLPQYNFINLTCYLTIPKLTTIDTTIQYEQLVSVMNNTINAPYVLDPFTTCSASASEFESKMAYIKYPDIKFIKKSLEDHPPIDSIAFVKGKGIDNKRVIGIYTTDYYRILNHIIDSISKVVNQRIKERATYFYHEAIVCFKNKKIDSLYNFEYYLKRETDLIEKNSHNLLNPILYSKHYRMKNIGIINRSFLQALIGSFNKEVDYR